MSQVRLCLAVISKGQLSMSIISTHWKSLIFFIARFLADHLSLTHSLFVQDPSIATNDIASHLIHETAAISTDQNASTATSAIGSNDPPNSAATAGPSVGTVLEPTVRVYRFIGQAMTLDFCTMYYLPEFNTYRHMSTLR